jgi:hypothetical protein
VRTSLAQPAPKRRADQCRPGKPHTRRVTGGMVPIRGFAPSFLGAGRPLRQGCS